MKSKFITDPLIDIRLYPAPSFDPDMTEVTFPDMHANALLLLYFLVRNGFVDIPEQEYAKFALLYSRPDLHPVFYTENIAAATILSSESRLKQVIVEFNELLLHIKVVDKKRLIRLIGDELVDRGVNDYFVIKLIALLHAQGALFEIVASNHGLEFVDACEKFTANNNTFVVTKLDNQKFGNSMHALQRSIALGVVQAREILDFYNNVYTKHLKIVSYTLDYKANEIQIFSHAGLGFEQIQALSERLGVRWSMHCVLDMAKNIDLINWAFAKYVNENRVHELEFDKIFEEALDTEQWIPNQVIFNIVCNREYAHLQRTSDVFKVTFVHGHDSNDPDPAHVTLDSNLGKFNYYFGRYVCYSTSGRQVAVILDSWMAKLDDIASKAAALRLQGRNRAGNEAHQIYLDLSKKTMDLYPSSIREFSYQCYQLLIDAGKLLATDMGWGQFIIQAALCLKELANEPVCDNVSQTSNSFLFFKTVERCRGIENKLLSPMTPQDSFSQS